MPRKQKLTERQLLPEDNVLAKPVEEVVFKEEDKSVKQVNPWGIENLEEFLYYCCPECPNKFKESESFLDHAKK